MRLLPDIPVPFELPNIAKIFGIDALATLGMELDNIDFGVLSKVFELEAYESNILKVVDPSSSQYNAPWPDMAPVSTLVIEKMGMDINKLPEIVGAGDLSADKIPGSGIGIDQINADMNVNPDSLQGGVDRNNQPYLTQPKNRAGQTLKFDWRDFARVRYGSCAGI